MQKQYAGWEYLNELGRQYHAEVERGFGTEVRYQKDGTLIDNRSALQKELAKEIVESAEGYLGSIATKLISREGAEIPTGNGERRKFSLFSLRERLSIEELVSEGALGVLQNLGHYDPKYAMSTFIGLYAPSAMYRRVQSTVGMVDLKPHVFNIVKKHCRLEKEQFVEEVAKQLTPRTGEQPSSAMAAALYFGFNNQYQSVDIHGEESTVNSPNQLEECFIDELTDTEKPVLDEELSLKIQEVLATLTPREEKVLRMRYGINPEQEDYTLEEIGEDFKVTKQRVQQIEGKAIATLKRPSRSKQLKEFF